MVLHRLTELNIWSPVGGPGDNVAFRWENLAGGSASLGMGMNLEGS